MNDFYYFVLSNFDPMSGRLEELLIVVVDTLENSVAFVSEVIFLKNILCAWLSHANALNAFCFYVTNYIWVGGSV